MIFKFFYGPLLPSKYIIKRVSYKDSLEQLVNQYTNDYLSYYGAEVVRLNISQSHIEMVFKSDSYKEIIDIMQKLGKTTVNQLSFNLFSLSTQLKTATELQKFFNKVLANKIQNKYYYNLYDCSYDGNNLVLSFDKDIKFDTTSINLYTIDYNNSSNIVMLNNIPIPLANKPIVPNSKFYDIIYNYSFSQDKTFLMLNEDLTFHIAKNSKHKPNQDIYIVQEKNHQKTILSIVRTKDIHHSRVVVEKKNQNIKQILNILPEVNINTFYHKSPIPLSNVLFLLYLISLLGFAIWMLKNKKKQSVYYIIAYIIMTFFIKARLINLIIPLCALIFIYLEKWNIYVKTLMILINPIQYISIILIFPLLLEVMNGV